MCIFHTVQVVVILEILIRRSGSAPVKLLTPEKHGCGSSVPAPGARTGVLGQGSGLEKHRNFVKTVLENRHSKNSSKETGATDPDVKVLESSPRGRQPKRKHEKSSILPEEHGKTEPSSKKWETNPVKKAGISNDDRRTEGQSRGSGRNKRRNFNSDSTASQKQGRNTHTKQTKVSKKFEVAGHRPSAAAKLAKHKKVRLGKLFFHFKLEFEMVRFEAKMANSLAKPAIVYVYTPRVCADVEMANGFCSQRHA
ncbi:hypothetical protein Acr_11g0005150 [Actinidia rufa]|uniref:Uncharacterized protein n=1 Tax=Actinidia rufa TaxID=165716 RepID=A0A7J0FD90_9ERIC|nr:hypothetical protein Acr_11g0005150 [Actinidia rufa]